MEPKVAKHPGPMKITLQPWVAVSTSSILLLTLTLTSEGFPTISRRNGSVPGIPMALVICCVSN